MVERIIVLIKNLKNRLFWKKTNEILRLCEKYKMKSDADLKSHTLRLREKLDLGLGLKDILVEAYATICEADRRVLGLLPYKVQIFGAVAMEYNNIIEMKTGEGKTLTATMIMYLHGLSGTGNFLITANSYLAERDSREMGKVYEWLGLTVAVRRPDDSSETSDDEKKCIYSSNIVYTDNSSLGFDYLKDNLSSSINERFIQSYKFAVIDEADDVLLDMAQTPLIISGKPKVISNYFRSTDAFVKMLEIGKDFSVSKDRKSVWFLEDGIERAERYFQVDGVLTKKWASLYRHLILALKANYLFRRDQDYIVEDSKIVLVDKANGRKLRGMQLEAGLHQAIETKEYLPVTREQQAMGMITFQNLFRMFGQLAGMTGTAMTDKMEFQDIYNLYVVKVPTHRKNLRKDYPDKIFVTNKEKLKATLDLVTDNYRRGRPILIETGSLSLSRLYSDLLLQKHIPHSLLNARSVEKEAAMIIEAGQVGAVTVSTSMAGRGTDIVLSNESKKLGGLLVIGTERMNNKRIDNQLRGRSGRQGDYGESIFYVSLEDSIVAENAPKRVRNFVKHHELDRDQVIKGRRFKRLINRIQSDLGEKERLSRFNTLQFGEVFRLQRDAIYSFRNKLMNAKTLNAIVNKEMEAAVSDFLEGDNCTINEVCEFIMYNISQRFVSPDKDYHTGDSKSEWLSRETAQALMKKREEIPNNDQWQYYMRIISLKAVDSAWVEQVDNLKALRSVVVSRSSGQRNPIYEYQKEALSSFQIMRKKISLRVLKYLLQSEVIVGEKGQLKVVFP